MYHFDDAEYLLNSINNGPYVMKLIADPNHPVFNIPQSQNDLNDDELKQYLADFRAKHFIMLAIPNELVSLVDQHHNAHDMWRELESLHNKEEHQLMKHDLQNGIHFHMDRMQTLLSESTSTIPFNNSHKENERPITFN